MYVLSFDNLNLFENIYIEKTLLEKLNTEFV